MTANYILFFFFSFYQKSTNQKKNVKSICAQGVTVTLQMDPFLNAPYINPRE